MDWTWYLLRFDGRINRALLWQALLIVALLAALLGVIGQVIHLIDAEGALKLSLKLDFDFGLDDLFKLVDPRAYRSLSSLDRTNLILKAFGLSLFLWIYLATAIKRLHDRDRRGWWLVLFFFLPGLYSQFSDLLPNSTWMLPFWLVASILWLWGLSRCSLCPAASAITGSVLIHWPRPRTALPLRKAGTSRARSNLSRPALAHPAACMLSGAHDRCSLHCPRSHSLPLGNPGRCRRARGA
ncbi:DUF805 domain-containing protein [Bradyrhizobium sp. CCBAU 11361]|uniref:DUF805 domain-containing protein n=1 Tax=Bradyrhizobium sp. CCBAU 11361 TaxID=1630812 RepID=UPI00230626BE|nr:DUF805 domain-containing protein [Bradyrhizobium sp. CCBAU 11361]